MTAGLKTLWIKKQSNPKQMNISDSQQPSGDKRILRELCGWKPDRELTNSLGRR
jgi:hypothetical protein